MEQQMTKKEKFQCWIAVILTSGEFTIAIILAFSEGHLFALYLAITYAVRETSGGRHYHQIMIDALHKVWGKVHRE